MAEYTKHIGLKRLTVFTFFKKAPEQKRVAFRKRTEKRWLVQTAGGKKVNTFCEPRTEQATQ